MIMDIQLVQEAESGDLLIDFGNQPITNKFIKSSDELVPEFPLVLRVSSNSGLIKINDPFPVEEVKPIYDWLTCFEPEEHLDEVVEKIIQLPGVSVNSVFGAYSFKDDTTIERLRARGYTKTWRIDPELDLGVTDNCANVETFQSVFDDSKAKQIRDGKGAADVLIVRHVIEHAYKITDFVNAIRKLTKPGGYVVWELPDCEQSLENGDCTMIWEEHAYYFTSNTFRQLLFNHGFEIVHFDSYPYPIENSIVAIVKNTSVDTILPSLDQSILNVEIARARKYLNVLNARRNSVREKLSELHNENGPIAIFGAGHQTATFISIMGISDLICCVIDDNKHKQDMLMPIEDLQIIGSEVLYSKNIKICLLGLNPQNHQKVMDKHQLFIQNGGKFISIFPGTEMDIELIK